jgi:hypothetical protein
VGQHGLTGDGFAVAEGPSFAGGGILGHLCPGFAAFEAAHMGAVLGQHGAGGQDLHVDALLTEPASLFDPVLGLQDLQHGVDDAFGQVLQERLYRRPASPEADGLKHFQDPGSGFFESLLAVGRSARLAWADHPLPSRQRSLVQAERAGGSDSVTPPSVWIPEPGSGPA